MLELVQVLAVMTVALAAALSVAHALELPGKRRLDEPAYRTVQTIYYPGFTIGGGVGEAGGIVLTALLAFLVPRGTAAAALTLLALGGLVAAQAVFWLVVQPVNRHWVAGQAMGAAGSAFFGVGARGGAGGERSWTELRDRWERAHVVRAALTGASLLALVVSLVLSP